MAAGSLDEVALQRHKNFVGKRNLENFPTWTEYSQSIVLRFGNSGYENPMSVLLALKQTGAVSDYQHQFDVDTITSIVVPGSKIYFIKLYSIPQKPKIAVK